MVPDHTGCAHPTTSGRMVSVPVSGAGCRTHVRYDVGGGWQVADGVEHVHVFVQSA